jgi:lactocepin
VQVTPNPASVKVNATVQLTASATDANGNAVPSATFTWQSSDGPTASVNSTGLVTGKKTGTVTITATSNGKSGTSTVTVTP